MKSFRSTIACYFYFSLSLPAKLWDERVPWGPFLSKARIFIYLWELLIVRSNNNKICRPLCQKKKKKKAANRVHLRPTCFTRIQPASVIRQQVARLRLNIYASVTVCTPNTLVRAVDCLVNTGVHTELILFFLHDAKDPLKRFMSCKTKKGWKPGNSGDTRAPSRRQRTIDGVQTVAKTSDFWWRRWIYAPFIFYFCKITYFLISVCHHKH